MSIKVKLKSFVNNIKVAVENNRHTRYFTNDKRDATKTKLNKSQLKQAKNFYKPYTTINPLFHAFYTEKTGAFDVRYIPEDIWFTKIDRYYNNREKAKVLDNKSYYEKMFSGRNVKHPETIIHRINGFWYDKSMGLLTLDKVKEIIGKETALFVKTASDSCGGAGVKYITNKDAEEFEKVVKKGYDVVIQRPIKQHPELNRVGANAVNTIRILSLLTKNEVKVYSAVLRMGIGDAKVDNASRGGITCGINDDGRLKDIAYNMYGKIFKQHPTTNIKFSEVQIPAYNEAVNLVRNLHPMIPNFRLVSWDIAINEFSEPVLIEVNLCMGQLDFHQLNNGPVFKEDTKKILEEVFR